MGDKKEYDEGFLKFIHDNDPAYYNELYEENLNPKEDPLSNESYKEMNKRIDRYVQIEAPKNNDVLKRNWLVFVIASSISGFIFMVIYLLIGFQNAIPLNIAVLLLASISVLYPFYAIKIGRVAGSQGRNRGKYFYRDREKAAFWFYIVIWFFFGSFFLLITVIIFLGLVLKI